MNDNTSVSGTEEQGKKNERMPTLGIQQGERSGAGDGEEG